MKSRVIVCGGILFLGILATQLVASSPAASNPNAASRLPASLPPEIYAWFWTEQEFRPEGYREFVDLIADNSNFGLLTASLRTPRREVTSSETHEQIRRAVRYAHERGLRVAFDLDVRLARGRFLERFPEQQQWMLRIRSFRTRRPGPTRAAIQPMTLQDHMTWPDGQYELLRGRLLRIYQWLGERKGVENGLVEIRDGYLTIEESSKQVVVELPSVGGVGESQFIVVAGFEYRTPDVFSPALLNFQREIYEQYSDVPLDGVLKDEWGFPPVYSQGPKEGDFWYSKPLEAQYRNAGGGDLLRDGILMAYGIGGSTPQRIAAINRYLLD